MLISFFFANPSLSAGFVADALADRNLVAMSSVPLISQDFDGEDDFWDDDWDDDEFWEDDWDDEGFYDDEEFEEPATRAKKQSNEKQLEASVSPPVATKAKKEETETIAEKEEPVETKPEKSQLELEIEDKIRADLEVEKAKRENNYIKLANTFKRSPEEFERLYSQYGDLLKGLNPENPKDLREIEKLIEIVGVPKRERKIRREATLTHEKPDDPIVNFSARNISVRDAFATLARVSGKSITVSGSIQARDTISVVEINDQPFSRAFLSLVDAADVDFRKSVDNYTILKKRGAKSTSLISGFDTTDIDLSLPLEERYADLTYDNEDLSGIIKDLANKYGVDVVMTANPTERITLKVRGINIEDAFELLFAGSQFSYTRKDDTFVVYSSTNKNFSLDKKTVLFPLKYLEAQEASKLLPAELKNLVQVSDNQNAFIAEGSKAELTQLYDFIRTIDKPVPQVELVVKLVEVAQSFSRGHNLYQSPFTIGRLGNEVEDSTGNVINRGIASHFGLDELGVFTSSPTYNQNSSNSQIKVNQRLLVTSGKSAKINFDEDVNVVLNSGEANNQGSGVVQNQRIQRITAGNSMDITPIVGGGGVVTVKVEIEVSANGTVDQNTGVPERTIRRRISSEIQVGDHETIAIGGLFDDRKGKTRNSELPLISRIPIIGDLFGNNSRDKDLRELLILITPNIKTGEDLEEVFLQASEGIF